MGEYQYLRCRTLVYKFGVLWFWKCDGACKCCGGRERVWEKAYDRAFNHARESIETITYRDEESAEEESSWLIPDFDEFMERTTLGSPVMKHLSEQGEEIVRRVKE